MWIFFSQIKDQNIDVLMLSYVCNTFCLHILSFQMICQCCLKPIVFMILSPILRDPSFLPEWL